LPDSDNVGIQVDAYATTATAARDVGVALRDAFEPYGYVVAYNGEDRDTATGLYRFGFTVEFWVDRGSSELTETRCLAEGASAPFVVSGCPRSRFSLKERCYGYQCSRQQSVFHRSGVGRWDHGGGLRHYARRPDGIARSERCDVHQR